MAEQTPDPAGQPPVTPEGGEPLDPAVALMPRWMPVMIGAVLVVMAAFAVLTGLRYRNASIVRPVAAERSRVTRSVTSPGPPGEPGAGASRVLPSEQDSVPVANEAVTGRSRAVIIGGPGGVTSMVRMWARRGMTFDVTPATAMVYVNNVPMGEVSQFNSPSEAYDFAEQGSYTVRLTAERFKDRTFVVTASSEAEQELARIVVALERQP